MPWVRTHSENLTRKDAGNGSLEPPSCWCSGPGDPWYSFREYPCCDDPEVYQRLREFDHPSMRPPSNLFPIQPYYGPTQGMRFSRTGIVVPWLKPARCRSSCRVLSWTSFLPASWNDNANHSWTMNHGNWNSKNRHHYRRYPWTRGGVSRPFHRRRAYGLGLWPFSISHPTLKARWGAPIVLNRWMSQKVTRYRIGWIHS